VAKPSRAKGLGITDADYAAMLARQYGGCAICGRPPKTRRLHVDHDHRTGAVRGLLCHRCNRNLPTWVTLDWLHVAGVYLTSGAEGVGDSLTANAAQDRLQRGVAS
jgi:hypothetical protein